MNQSKWDQPPYAINAANSRQGLAAKTAAMTAYYNQDPSDIHYNRHNLYGLEESMATHRVVANVTGERPFILTRCGCTALPLECTARRPLILTRCSQEVDAEPSGSASQSGEAESRAPPAADRGRKAFPGMHRQRMGPCVLLCGSALYCTRLDHL